MKKIAIAAAVLLAATPALAGNLEVFIAPDPPEIINTPMGGSNAAWLIPILALAVIGLAVAAD